MTRRHRNQIAAHLLSLNNADRYMRFGYCAGDDQIKSYATSIDFQRDEVFGIFNRHLALVAMAHLAYTPKEVVTDKAPSVAEFGVSVEARARGKGFGAQLFAHAVLHARNRSVDTLIIHALSDNAAMLHIARRAGATVERQGSDSAARLKLPSDNLATHWDEMTGVQAAEMNYQLKLGAYRLTRFFNAITEVVTNIMNARASRFN